MRIIIFLIFFVLFTPCSFGRELYTGERTDYYESLSRLEKSVYAREYEQDDMSVRVDRLENSIYGQKYRGSIFTRIENLKNSTAQAKKQKLDQKKLVMLSMLENRYFGASYEIEAITNRLTRLEKNVLGRQFLGSADYRLQNLEKNTPLSIVGLSVEGRNGDRVSIRPQLRVMESKSASVNNVNGEDDYFESIYKDKNSRYLRWRDFPITVYLAKINNSDNREFILKAIESWNRYVQLSVVDREEHANIIIDEKLYKNGNIEIVSNIPPAGVQVIVHTDGQETYYYSYLLHELGHAVGIWGHSNNPKDIMYEFKEVKSDIAAPIPNKKKDISLKNAPDAPSARDMNTLIKIYNSPGSLEVK